VYTNTRADGVFTKEYFLRFVLSPSLANSVLETEYMWLLDSSFNFICPLERNAMTNAFLRQD